ncbi:hypothetical protein MLD38_000596 [Melastoma candidum]|uniref:Uncharacterized protein n=1 Tax=Melastoma candidum TaxID=119954 RepID=A0ACB9SJ80_9MYRT|nr:hypothetical protein MLD38_000596 [Melastoma candidum]
MSSDHSSFEGAPSLSPGRNSVPRSSIEIVSKPVSDGLLRKFSDVSAYDFDRAQSSIWSPPIARTAFLESSASVRAAAPRKMRSVSRSSSSPSVIPTEYKYRSQSHVT